jgi:hypothetical protein
MAASVKPSLLQFNVRPFDAASDGDKLSKHAS